MNQKEYEILKFLTEQKEPANISQFPDDVKSLFPNDGFGSKEGSLFHFLEIDMKNKGYVNTSNAPYYSATILGKSAFDEELK